MNRRDFLCVSPAASAGMRLQAVRLPIRKAVEFNMLPKELGVPDRFRLAKDAGFERIECPTTPDTGEAAAMKERALKTGLRIHSVMNTARQSRNQNEGALHS